MTAPLPSVRQFALVCLTAFVVLVSYGLSRPAVESLFLQEQGSEHLPLVWLTVGLAVTVTVAIYNHFAAVVDLIKLLACAAVVSVAVLISLLILHVLETPGSVFLLYVWKDVYIVVLLEIVWSFANSVFSLRSARAYYGWFLVVGSLGGVVGNALVGWASVRLGTVWTLLLPAGLLASVAAAAFVAAARVRHPLPPPKAAKQSRWGAPHTVLRGSYLPWMVALVALVQIVITLIDYQYNYAVEQTFQQLDERTQVMGRVYMVIDGSALVLQLLTGPIVRAAGVSLTLIAVPTLVGSLTVAFVALPTFLLMAITKVASKSFDYSLFKASKEMLYIPLSYEQKTQGKAWIDMLTYRLAKGGASVLVLGLLAASLRSTVMLLVVVLIGCWIAVTVVIVRRFRALKQSAEDRPS